MWSRVELKEKGKAAFSRNYWRCVLAALILAVFVESGGNNNNSNTQDAGYQEDWAEGVWNDDDFGDESRFQDGILSGSVLQEEETSVLEVIPDASDLYKNRKFPFLLWISDFFRTHVSVMMVYLFTVGVLILSIFVFPVLEIGGCRFFIENAHSPAVMGEFLFGFRSGAYGKMVLTQFLRTLYTFLWTFLLIIPGIVKSYEYRMIPYLLADNPELTTEEAFFISREMMDGNKWDTFVLDLSFLGWELLSAVTLGIAGIFYVNPYEYATKAELYLKLRAEYLR